MFNRKLQVSMVKSNEKEATAAQQEEVFERKITHVTNAAKSLFKYGAVGVAGLIALDTIRQVLVAQANKS